MPILDYTANIKTALQNNQLDLAATEYQVLAKNIQSIVLKHIAFDKEVNLTQTEQLCEIARRSLKMDSVLLYELSQLSKEKFKLICRTFKSHIQAFSIEDGTFLLSVLDADKKNLFCKAILNSLVKKCSSMQEYLWLNQHLPIQFRQESLSILTAERTFLIKSVDDIHALLLEFSSRNHDIIFKNINTHLPKIILNAQDFSHLFKLAPIKVQLSIYKILEPNFRHIFKSRHQRETVLSSLSINKNKAEMSELYSKVRNISDFIKFLNSLDKSHQKSFFESESHREKMVHIIKRVNKDIPKVYHTLKSVEAGQLFQQSFFNALIEQIQPDNEHMTSLKNQLKAASNKYFNTQACDYDSFKEQCFTAINIAHKNLPKKRSLLVKLSVYILTLGLLPMASACHSYRTTGHFKSRFFEHSIQKELDKIKDAIINPKLN